VRSSQQITILPQALIAIGPFSLLELGVEEEDEEKPKLMSPFNVRDTFPSPLWTKGEVKSLFREYQHERQSLVDDAILEDIFGRTNG